MLITFLRLSSRLLYHLIHYYVVDIRCRKLRRHNLQIAPSQLQKDCRYDIERPVDGTLVNEQETIPMLEKLPYSKLVEKAVLEMIQGGVPIRQITHGAVVALCQLDTA